MDVVILLTFTAIFGGWLIWVSGRGETRHPKHGDRHTAEH
jgi:hypothetical protein